MLGNALKQLFIGFIHRARTALAVLLGLQPPAPLTLGGVQQVKPGQIRLARLSDDAALAPPYLAKVTWPAYQERRVPRNLLSNPLFQIWSEIPGGTKWAHYFPIYQELFESFRERPVKILEIGVFQGASLRLWRSYFPHPESRIVGIDIDPTCAKFHAPEKGVYVCIGSQTDIAFLTTVLHEHGPFDFIVDDGSHISSHIINSFNALFLSGLKDTGIYLVEDLHANYWPEWRDSRRTFFDICREIIEHMHAHYREVQLNDFRIQRAQADLNDVQVPLIATLVREIRLFDSIAVIHKAPANHVPFWMLSDELKFIDSAGTSDK